MSRAARLRICLGIAVGLALAGCGATQLPPPESLPTGPAFPAVEGRTSPAPGPQLPPPAEVRHVEAETYIMDISAPQSAHASEIVFATFTLKPLGDMAVQTDSPAWKLTITAPADVTFKTRIIDASLMSMTGAGATAIFSLDAADPGVKHITIDVSGVVCDPDFCDTISEKLSWNLAVE